MKTHAQRYALIENLRDTGMLSIEDVRTFWKKSVKDQKHFLLLTAILCQTGVKDLKALTKELENPVAKIAAKHLGVDSLQTRGNDEDDFYTLAVWQLRDALEAAYQAGRKAG